MSSSSTPRKASIHDMALDTEATVRINYNHYIIY
jgi:hypothetical protein